MAVFKCLFAYGLNYSTLYALSFVIPKYVENQINEQYATTVLGWSCFAISVLIFAPVMEELIFRGIIFQKLTTAKNATKALLVSAIAFSIIHFCFDIFTLFISGILYIILYTKTKNLIVPMISHCFYNFIVIIVKLKYQYFSTTNSLIQTTVIEYRQHFIGFCLGLIFV